MTVRGRLLVFLLSFSLFLAAMVPLSAAVRWSGLDRYGIWFARAEGLLWNGRIERLSYRGLPVGDLDLNIKPLSLLGLRVRAGWTLTGGDLEGHGVLETDFGSRMGLEDTVLDGRLPRWAGVEPLLGSISAKVDRIAFDKAGCSHADAYVWTNMLSESDLGFDWRGPELSGHAECSGRWLRLPLEGASNGETVQIDTMFASDLSYRTELRVRTTNGQTQSVLSFLGFRGQGGIYSLEQEGALTP